jgi:hypothetical protein
LTVAGNWLVRAPHFRFREIGIADAGVIGIDQYEILLAVFVLTGFVRWSRHAVLLAAFRVELSALSIIVADFGLLLLAVLAVAARSALAVAVLVAHGAGTACFLGSEFVCGAFGVGGAATLRCNLALALRIHRCKATVARGALFIALRFALPATSVVLIR